MDKFEYVTILISLILGLGISQLLIGLVRIIRRWNTVRTYLPHFLCILLIFGLHVQEWWVNFALASGEFQWRFLQFLLLITYPVILYLMARLLFPLSWKGNVDLKAFYMSNYRKLFLLAAFMTLIAIPQNILLLKKPLTSQAWQLAAVAAMLLPVIFRTHSDRFHYTLTTMMTILALVYIVYINPQLM